MATDHYKTLGVEPDADPTIIKRRYRLLVRENHPDAVATGERAAAHERMLAINAAWTVLSDPAERARYDRARRAAVSPGAGRAADGRSADGRAANGTGSSADANGAARTARPAGQSRHAPRSATTRSASARGAASRGAGRGSSRSANPRTRMLTLVFEAAELYFFHGRAQEAIEICNRVMKFDPKNAEAAALLGDIYAEQGRKDIAVLMYERAVRNQPDNALYRQKWEALRQSTASARQNPTTASTSSASTASTASANAARNVAGGVPRVAGNGSATSARTATRTAAARPVTARPAPTPLSSTSRASTAPGGDAGPQMDYAPEASGAGDRRQMIGGLALLGSAAALVVWCNMEMLPAGRVFEPTSAQLMLTSGAAGALGAALPLLGMVRPFGQVRRGTPAFTGWPLLLCMALAGAIWFPLALAVYLVASLLWSLWHKSLLMMLTTTLFLSATMIASASQQPAEQISALLQSALLTWSGRAIFPAMLLGWAVGSLLRSRRGGQ